MRAVGPIVKLALAALVVLVVLVAGAVGFVYSAPERATHFVFNQERHRSGLVRREIDLPGGLHYVYLEGGKGEPLMLLHGFGADKDNFVRVARYLTPRYHLIVPDHIGFGESAHPPEADYSPPAQVERLRALARALGIKSLHLGGSSMGGQIAMTYAALYPAEVESLWLLDPAGVWSVPQREMEKFRKRTGRDPLLIRSGADLKQTLAFAMSDPPFIPQPIIDVMAQPRIKNFALEKRILEQLHADAMEERVKGLATPALIVWGSDDRVLDVASAEVLHKLLPRSRVKIMPGTGHIPMLERPWRSAEDYFVFRASLRGAQAPNSY
jgi:pimeloyl-ACP methyl ester carboxylesterase